MKKPREFTLHYYAKSDVKPYGIYLEKVKGELPSRPERIKVIEKNAYDELKAKADMFAEKLQEYECLLDNIQGHRIGHMGPSGEVYSNIGCKKRSIDAARRDLDELLADYKNEDPES